MFPDNTQPQSKPVYVQGGNLVVHSVWHTIQGEGPYAGMSAVFLRLVGCNLQCRLCDTDYTSRNNYMSLEVLRDRVESAAGPHTRLLVISGGEPFRQNIVPFTNMMADHDWLVQVETNGTLYLPDFPYGRAVVVCSPKTAQIHRAVADRVACWKYIVQWGAIDPEDGLPSSVLGMPVRVARPPETNRAEIFVQPLDEGNETRNKRNRQTAADVCLRFGYRLCVQMHKLVGLT